MAFIPRGQIWRIASGVEVPPDVITIDDRTSDEIATSLISKLTKIAANPQPAYEPLFLFSLENVLHRRALTKFAVQLAIIRCGEATDLSLTVGDVIQHEPDKTDIGNGTVKLAVQRYPTDITNAYSQAIADISPELLGQPHTVMYSYEPFKPHQADSA